MTYSFHCIAKSGQEVYETGKDLLTVLMRSNHQIANFRQMGDTLVAGSLRHGEEARFFLHNEHWVSIKHARAAQRPMDA